MGFLPACFRAGLPSSTAFEAVGTAGTTRPMNKRPPLHSTATRSGLQHTVVAAVRLPRNEKFGVGELRVAVEEPNQEALHVPSRAVVADGLRKEREGVRTHREPTPRHKVARGKTESQRDTQRDRDRMTE